MTLEQIKTFIAVFRHGSYLKASEALFVPQPTISHRIKQLEQELGETLLLRGKGKVQLTEKGRVFFPYAESVLDSIERGRRAVEDLSPNTDSRLSIASTLTMSSCLLPEIITSFIQSSPDADITVAYLPAGELGRSLKTSKELHLCVSPIPVHEPGLTCRLIRNESLYLIVSRHHHLARQSSISIHSIFEEILILFQKGALFRDMLDNTLKKFHPDYHVQYETSNIELMKSFITHHGAVSLLRPSYVKKELDNKEFVKIKIENNPFPKLPTFIVSRTDGIHPLEHLFIEHMIAYMNPEANNLETHQPEVFAWSRNV